MISSIFSDTKSKFIDNILTDFFARLQHVPATGLSELLFMLLKLCEKTRIITT